MKKPLRIALIVGISVIGLACSILLLFHKFGNLLTSQRDALFICAFALPSIALSLMSTAMSPGLRRAKFICAGLSCFFLAVGVAALFIPMQPFILDVVGAAACFNFSAITFITLAVLKAKKQKQPPQENPQ